MASVVLDANGIPYLTYNDDTMKVKIYEDGSWINARDSPGINGTHCSITIDKGRNVYMAATEADKWKVTVMTMQTLCSQYLAPTSCLGQFFELRSGTSGGIRASSNSGIATVEK